MWEEENPKKDTFSEWEKEGELGCGMSNEWITNRDVPAFLKRHTLAA